MRTVAIPTSVSSITSIFSEIHGGRFVANKYEGSYYKKVTRGDLQNEKCATSQRGGLGRRAAARLKLHVCIFQGFLTDLNFFHFS